MFVVFCTVYLYVLCIYDFFHILGLYNIFPVFTVVISQIVVL